MREIIIEAIIALVLSIFGSGGVLLWLLTRRAKVRDDKSSLSASIEGINDKLTKLQEGLTMALENDLVIFNALRTHEINGESEVQEKSMKKYLVKTAVNDENNAR